MTEESGGAEERGLVSHGVALVAPLKRPRHRCPFYGFAPMPAPGGIFRGGVLLDQQGNQCPLILWRYSPCAMEMEGETPDWDRCRFFNIDTYRRPIEMMFERCTVFPRELTAEGAPLRVWTAYVMDDRAVERPSKENVPGKE